MSASNREYPRFLLQMAGTSGAVETKLQLRPQSELSMFVKFRMSMRNCTVWRFPAIICVTSCVAERSMRVTIGMNTAPRSTTSPRWLRR